MAEEIAKHMYTFPYMSVDPEKEDTYKEGLLVAHWAQVLKTEPNCPFCAGASHANCTSGRSYALNYLSLY